MEDGDNMLTTNTKTPDWLEPEGWWRFPKHHPVTSQPTNQKNVHELIMHPATLIPNVAFKNPCLGASLVVQWLRIRLPMQGTWVRALVQEDATCCRATKPVRHNYWACALEPASHNYWACVLLLKPACLQPMLPNKRSHCNEKPVHHNEE